MTEKDYVVADLGLADWGRKEMRIAETEMPGLMAIREHLLLNRPIYARTAAYGHFGRAPEADGGFSWGRTDLVDTLRGAF